jgi:hypothetical protein
MENKKKIYKPLQMEIENKNLNRNDAEVNPNLSSVEKNYIFIVNNIFFKILFLTIIIYFSKINFTIAIMLFVLYMLILNKYVKNTDIEPFSSKKKRKKKKKKKKRKQNKITEQFLQDVPKSIFSHQINGNIKGGGFSSIDQNIKKLDIALKTFENNIN